MSNKGRYFTREIDLDSIVRNPLRSNLNANGKTITNLGPPVDQSSVARMQDISGGGATNTWYLYPAFADISMNCNGIQDVSAITFCGRQTYLRQTNTTFDISSNRSIRFNNNQLFLQNNGNIGIGTNTPIYSLDVSGSARMRYIIDINTSDGSNNSILIGTSNGIRWSKDLSLNNLDVSNKTTINDLSATKIWSRDLSAVNLQASGTGIINDLSATKIWSRDLSAVNLQVSATGIINDLSATKIWSRDLSAVNLQVSTTGIINDLSATKIWSRDLSAVNLQVSTSAIINDLSATKIWTRDLSAVNANITNIIANNIDASFNIIDASDNKNYYITFSESSGYQKIKIDTNKLIYNPGLDRLGINIEPIYNLDVSGSLRPTTIIDRNNSAGTLGQVLTSTVSGIVWSSSSSNINTIKVFSLNQSNPDISMSTATKFYPVLVDSSGTVIGYIDNRDFVFDASRNRLGIGNPDPSYNLDVSGSVRITNQLLVGAVTTSSLTFDVVGDTRIQSDNIRLGTNSGNSSQGSYGISIGYNAGAYTQLTGAVSIGYSTGQTAQGANSVAIGASAGQSTQGGHSVAIGFSAGQTGQGEHAVAIGREAGAFYQGSYSIAIGYYAGRTGQPQNSIVLNATNSDLTGSSTNGLFIAPLRSTTPTMAISKALYYNTTTNEVLYGDISNGGSSSSNQWTTSGSNIYNTNYLTGNVAIGKTIPSYSLDVSGSFKSSRIIDVSNSSGLSGETMISLGNGNGYKWITPVYGSFSSDISQNIDISGGLGYPTAITYNRAEISNLCDFSGSRIYVRRSGIFKFSYSIQMVQTANQSHKVYIYIKQNGVILDRTSSTIMLLKDSEIFPMCEYILPLNKGDYIEVIFYSLGTTVTAVYLLDSTHIPPYFPSAPSIISNIYSLVTYP